MNIGGFIFKWVRLDGFLPISDIMENTEKPFVGVFLNFTTSADGKWYNKTQKGFQKFSLASIVEFRLKFTSWTLQSRSDYPLLQKYEILTQISGFNSVEYPDAACHWAGMIYTV